MKITQVKTLERMDRYVQFDGDIYFVACTHHADDNDPPAFELYDLNHGNAYFGESIIGLGDLSDKMSEIDPDWFTYEVDRTIVDEEVRIPLNIDPKAFAKEFIKHFDK